MATVGILGAGQLGRMLALAGYPLGLKFRFLDVTGDPPSRDLGDYVRGSAYTDASALKAFEEGTDVITFEFESIPAETLEVLSRTKPVFPSARALETAQDRLSEKQLFAQLGIETPKFIPVGTEQELREGLAQIGFPAIVKTRRFGYDGKGQARLNGEDDVSGAWESLKDAVGSGNALILESCVPFDRELSVVAVRSSSGEIAYYPLALNKHRDGILRTSIAPAPNVSDVVEQTARGYVSRILRELDYVGVLALELFEVGGKLLANEIAPRVHNTGHWTIDGAQTSQFENHLRAILGFALGSTAARGATCMVNLIGEVPPVEELLAISHLHLHLYGKTPKAGRKVGHLTITAESPTQLEKLLDALPERLRACF